MFFYVSKLIWAALQPSSLIALFILAGLVTMILRPTWRVGRRLAFGGVLVFFIAGLSPLANLLILPLEQRYPPPDLAAVEPSVRTIIVLGGAEDGRISHARSQLTLNERGERITAAIGLARRMPRADLLVSAGAAGVLQSERAGGEAIVAFWRDAGIAPDRIRVEEESLTTYENATVAKRLLRPQAGERFLLVTSAFHMPRSVAAFRHAGFDVVPYPVDFRTAGWSDLSRFMSSPATGLRRLDEAAREWTGLLGYRLLGRSGSLFPSP
jgi:uncharacterized SAM-binding protein YcdF (DUF218 family)